MSYLTPQLIADEIGGWPRLNDALDDDGDGQVESGLLDRLMASASCAVDAFLQGRYATPFNPVPALVVEAALVFTMEKIYNRRKQGLNEVNPYEERASEMRKRLKKISDREESLNARESEAYTPGAVIHSESRLNGSTL
jgi:phage gp36-like protein